MTELNPCPVCQNNAELIEFGEMYYVGCKSCHVQIASFANPVDAEQVWNDLQPSSKTLRDEFAMAVLNGAIAANANHRPVSYDDLAADCYGVADAILKERSK